MIPRLNKWIKQKPTPKQTAALLLNNVEELFYGGGGGGGKSSYLLMAAAQYFDVPGYAAVIFRNKYTDLMKPEGLIPRSFDWWYNEKDAHWDGGQHQWRFRAGDGFSTLAFSYLDGPMDHFAHQSAAYQFVGLDEVVNIRENQATYLFTRSRKLTGMDLPIRFRACSNPPAREQVAKGSWVKRRYVNPKTRKEGVVFIPALMDDNPYLDAQSYRQSLSRVDPITRAQIEAGDWEIEAAGRMVERGWFKFVDILPTAGIRWVRFWDLASTDPTPENKDPDWTAGVKMGRDGMGQYFIAHAVRWRKAPGPTEMGIRSHAETDGRGRVEIFMEQEPGSSGVNTIHNYLTRVLPGWEFHGVRATGAKTARYAPFASQVEAGNVFLVRADWNEEYLDSAVLFPEGEHDDWEDATSGAFQQLTRGGSLIR